LRARIVLIGAGEHGRVVAEALRLQPESFDLVGFVDPAPCEETIRRFGIRRLGDDQALAEQRGPKGVLGLGVVGVSASRANVVSRVTPMLDGWATVIHPRACVAPSAEIGEGAVILAGAIVNSGARVGRHAIVNSGAIVEHDVTLGEFVQVSPGAIVGGGARVGSGAFIGLGAGIRDHVTIGTNVLVAMGAIVICDVADGARVRGVPAR